MEVFYAQTTVNRILFWKSVVGIEQENGRLACRVFA